MASLLHLSDREIRAPETEVLPDSRKRLTRFFSVPSKLAIPPELNIAYGTIDQFATAPAGWTGLRLTNKKLTDDVPRAGQDSRPILQLVYEQIDATNETSVGSDDISYDESGFKIVNVDTIQFTTGTYAPGTVGSTTYGPDATCVLKDVIEDDDGTVRRIKRTFINGGTLSDETQTKNNAALQLRIIKTVKTAPATPAGFVLIDNPTQNPNGLPVFTYTFAKGNGEISREYRTDKQGATTFNPATTPVTLTAGAVVETIRYLTDSSVTTNPTTSNLSTPATIGVSKTDEDGYRVWTVLYGMGVGQVDVATETKNGGKLVLYHRIGLGAAPNTPGATIGGTVVTISTDQVNSDGYAIYDYRWAEGQGEISRGSEYRLSADGGVTGMTVTTIRALTATSVGTNPIAAPGGFALVQDTHEDQDGYRLWTGIFANGTGTVINSSELKNKGKLVIYNKVALNSAPSAPSPTIGGTVVAIRTEDKRDRFHEGMVVYDYMWAEGIGTISNDVDTRNNGKLIIYHLTALAVAPSAPSPTIGGTVVLIEDTSHDESGVTIYDRKWAEGKGVIAKSTHPHDAGLRTETWVSLGTGYDASFMLPVGVLIMKDSEEIDGLERWTVTCMQRSNGLDPVGFTGKLTAINVTNGGASYTSDPAVTIAAPPAGGTQATAHVVRSGSTVGSVVIDNPGAGYTSPPAIGFTGGGGSGAAATAVIDGVPNAPLQYEAWIPFRYPGQAKLYSDTVSGGGFGTITVVDTFLSPPIEVLVKGTHKITYQVDPTVGLLVYALWNPTQYATLRSKFANQAGPRSIVRGFEGYTAGAGSTVTGTDGGSGTTSVLGERLAASSAFSAIISGGPTMPDGATNYTLHAECQLAFIGFDGTQYYRRVVIEALPAALPALPV